MTCHEDRESYDFSRLRGWSVPQFDDSQTGEPNVFEVAGFPNREKVSSNCLAYFLDPAESHGFGDLFLSSLVSILNEQLADELSFELDSSDVVVNTEVSDGTDTRNRIDITVQTPTLSMAIENKVFAGWYNDLDDYYRKIKALSGIEGKAGEECKAKACVILLHAKPQSDMEHDERYQKYRRGTNESLRENAEWFSIDYDTLFEKVLADIGSRIVTANSRGLDLFRQFVEHYSQERKDSLMEQNDQTIEAFVQASKGLERELFNLRNAIASYRKAVRDKYVNVQDNLRDRLESVVPIDGVRLSSCTNKLWRNRFDNEVRAELFECRQEFELAWDKRTLVIKFVTSEDVAQWRGQDKNNPSLSLDDLYDTIFVSAFWEKEKRGNYIEDQHDARLEGARLTDTEEHIADVLYRYCERIINSPSVKSHLHD